MTLPDSDDWRNRLETLTDLIAPAPAAALGATLDHDKAPGIGNPLPDLWHWLFFWPRVQQHAIGTDGHPEKGSFLPDLGLPRRMWAGGRLTFHTPLEIGKLATRTSRIVDVQQKDGRSGRLAFVTVKHAVASAGRLAIEEEQDIVYRGPSAGAPAPTAAPEGGVWQRKVEPNEAFLFRYSALTFNAHRIHYDKPYATGVEGYPDLVVHGPLIATLLMDLLRQNLPQATVRSYTFKAVRPTFLGNPFILCGRLSMDEKTVELWATDHQECLTMTARATLD